MEEKDSYPVTVTLRSLKNPSEEDATTAQDDSGAAPNGLSRTMAPDDSDDLIRSGQRRAGRAETVRTKYVIGCDGAHSWTRRQLGIEMEGDATQFVWGVIGQFVLLSCRVDN